MNQGTSISPVVMDFDLGCLGGQPQMFFYWKEIRGKRRLIGKPNAPMRALHQNFEQRIRRALRECCDQGREILRFRSATGCVKGSNPQKNALRHRLGHFFYITDIKDAYPGLDLERLALFITRVVKHAAYEEEVSLKFFATDSRRDIIRDDSFFREVLGLLQTYFSGSFGRGLAVGGPSSPFLMNLFCEVFIDAPLRELCKKWGSEYARYVDDLTFSSELIISAEQRREIRKIIEAAGFRVNHRKSKVLARSMGAIFVTRVGLAEQPGTVVARLVFPQEKRRHLHRAIHDYLARRMDWPEEVSGYIAEFLYYYKAVGVKTATDRKTFALCRSFERVWAMHRDGPVPWAKPKRR